jgi:hypothetical protein
LTIREYSRVSGPIGQGKAIQNAKFESCQRFGAYLRGAVWQRRTGWNVLLDIAGVTGGRLVDSK